MKRLLVLLIVLMFTAGCGLSIKDPKVMACEQACKTALKKCKNDYADNTAKIAGCQVTYKACIDACN